MADSTQKFSSELVPKSQDGTLQVNSVLQNRFRITGVLGVGGMGSVYLARDLRFTNVIRQVAVKEMLNMQSDPALKELTLKNFSREADVLASLTHPAVPQIYDVFASKDRAYLVMEYIEGQDLEARLTQSPTFLDTEKVRQWAIQLCDVLNYLHTHQPDPIIFRDVKPSNVMIDKAERVRLIDFGIAKPFQRAATEKGTMIGTDGYAPPEQYKGNATPVGDIYALGATLHHVLTRRDPRLEAPFSFAERPIRTTNIKVSPEFEAIIMKALNYEPGNRYQNVLDMKAALEALSRPGEAAISVPGARTPADAFAEEGSKIAPIWKAKVEDEIRSSPVFYKGTVYVGTYDNNLYGFNATDGKPKLKYATNDGIAGTPAIAPDENLIIFGSEDHYLYAMDIRTHKINWQFETAKAVRSSIATAHGHAFFGGDDGLFYALRLTTGRPAWNYNVSAPIRSRAAITDERIIFGTEAGDLIGLDLGGSIKFRFKAKRAITSSPFIHDGVAYVGSMDNHIYAVDIKMGYSIWRFRTGKPIISSPIVVNKVIYIGSADGHLYAIDLNGHELWKFKTEGQVVSSPAFVNGSLYFGSTDKKIYSVDARKGLLRWEYETGGPVVSSACIADNVVYIGSTDQHLYALNT